MFPLLRHKGVCTEIADSPDQGKCFHKQQDEDNAFSEFVESQCPDIFCCRNELFLIGKTVLIVMIPILIYKDVFEPSYKILKFRVQNCCYSSTNLVTRRSRENCPDLEYITTPGVWSTAKD